MSDPPATPLAISLLGPLSLTLNGAPVPRLRYRKAEAILVLLILRHGRPLDRAWLAALLWPDTSQRQGLATLRRYLAYLRQALGPEAGRLHAPSPHSLAFDLTDARVDLLAFEAARARGDRASLEAAVSLYRGALLEGWTDEWLFEERTRCEQGFLAALLKLAAMAREAGEVEAAEGYLRRVVSVDPLRESAQRGLMALQAAGGSYGAALSTYRELRERLHSELNAEPDPETEALFRRIREGVREKAARGREGEGARKREDEGARGRPEREGEVRTFPRSAEHRAPSTEHGSAATLTCLFTDIEGSAPAGDAGSDRSPRRPPAAGDREPRRHGVQDDGGPGLRGVSHADAGDGGGGVGTVGAAGGGVGAAGAGAGADGAAHGGGGGARGGLPGPAGEPGGAPAGGGARGPGAGVGGVLRAGAGGAAGRERSAGAEGVSAEGSDAAGAGVSACGSRTARGVPAAAGAGRSAK